MGSNGVQFRAKKHTIQEWPGPGREKIELYNPCWGSLPLNMFSMVAFVIYAYNLGPLTAYNCKRQVASNNKNMLPYLCQTQRPSMNMFLNKYTYISTLIYLPCNSTCICVFERILGRHVFDMILFNYSHVRIECSKTCAFR